MAKNDLNQPLHRKVHERPPRRPPVLAPVLISAALMLALVAAFWVAVVDDPDGGRPVAVATIEEAAPAATGSVSSGTAANATDAPPLSDAVAEAALELASLPLAPPVLGADPGLVEQSAFGPLPRLSPDGRRPREAYARPVAAPAEGSTRIVLVVGGLGLSQTGTQNAIEMLPEDPKLDTQLQYAFDLLRGVQVNARFPAAAEQGIPN